MGDGFCWASVLPATPGSARQSRTYEGRRRTQHAGCLTIPQPRTFKSFNISPFSLQNQDPSRRGCCARGGKGGSYRTQRKDEASVRPSYVHGVEYLEQGRQCHLIFRQSKGFDQAYSNCLLDLPAPPGSSKLDDEERMRSPHGVPHAHNAITHQLPEERAQRPQHESETQKDLGSVPDLISLHLRIKD